MDIRLTSDGGDIDLTAGSMSLVTGNAAIAQHMAARLRTWQTESPYDRAAGMPWLQLADQAPEAVAFFASQEILGTPGVLELVEPPALAFDTTTRSVTGTARARTISGDVASFSDALSEP